MKKLVVEIEINNVSVETYEARLEELSKVLCSIVALTPFTIVKIEVQDEQS